MADTEMMDTEAIDSTSVELFWGQELSSKTKTYEYTGESDEEEGIETTIELRGACLGVNAKNERNVVNVTTEDSDGNSVTHTILSMRLEKNEQVPLFINLKPPVKLELVQGSGPISIIGNMTSVLNDFSDDEDDNDEEEFEEKTKSPVTQPTRKMKRPAESPIERPAKKNTKAIVEVPDDSDEEDSEMDESYDFPSKKQTKQNRDEDSDDDDDDDDDMDDNDDDDDDDMSDEDEEEESSEEEVKPVVAKKGGKGLLKKPVTTKGASQTPKPKKPLKPALKQPSSAPKEGKKTSKAAATPSMDEIKKRLISSPGLPKKVDKFNNLLKNNYKINDDNTKKELWEFVKKSKNF